MQALRPWTNNTQLAERLSVLNHEKSLPPTDPNSGIIIRLFAFCSNITNSCTLSPAPVRTAARLEDKSSVLHREGPRDNTEVTLEEGKGSVMLIWRHRKEKAESETNKIMKCTVWNTWGGKHHQDFNTQRHRKCVRDFKIKYTVTLQDCQNI